MDFRKNKSDFSKLLIIFLIILINSFKASIISTPSEIRSSSQVPNLEEKEVCSFCLEQVSVDRKFNFYSRWYHIRCFVKNKALCRGEVDIDQNFENYDIETPKKEKVHLECSSPSDSDSNFVNNVKLAIQLNSDLINAVKSNNIERIRRLIENGADINVLGEEDGWSLLHIASHKGHLKVVELLIQMNLPVNLLQNNGWTPLLLALNSGKSEIQNILIENGASLNFSDENGWISLHYAVKTGHLEIVKLLIENRADVNVSNNKGRTPLNFASKAAVRAYDERFTPLNSAAKKDRLEIVNLLVNNHADASVTYRFRWGHCETVHSLSRLEIEELFQEYCNKKCSLRRRCAN